MAVAECQTCKHEFETDDAYPSCPECGEGLAVRINIDKRKVSDDDFTPNMGWDSRVIVSTYEYSGVFDNVEEFDISDDTSDIDVDRVESEIDEYTGSVTVEVSEEFIENFINVE